MQHVLGPFLHRILDTTTMKLLILTPLLAFGLLTWLGNPVPSRVTERQDEIAALLAPRIHELQGQSLLLLRTGMQNRISVDSLRMRYEQMRATYKAVEMFIEYIDPTYVTQFLNGAPLPKLDVKSQFVDVLEPHGLQVLDEMVGEHQEQQIDTQLLVQELEYVHTRMKECSEIISSTMWSNRMLLEACRTGVVRVMAMGLSGFDRPGTGERFGEYASWASSTADVLKLFRSDLQRIGRQALLDQALSMLTSVRDSVCPLPDTAIDKVELIRTHLDPLFRIIGEIHLALGIELSTEIGPAQPVLNPRATSMFSESFFNAAATSGVHYKELNPELIELGKTLFFDPILSGDIERSCASCHDPSQAFTDGYKTSVSYERKGNIKRNAPTLINAVLARRFFYDLRAQRISDVVSHVVTDSQEFHSTLIDVVGRIRTSQEYISLFEKNFGTKGPASITSTNINLAIGAFLSTLTSFNSRVDLYMRGESVRLSKSERRGMNLFMGKALCATCHFPPTFAGYVPPAFVESESEIIGVPMHQATEHAVADPDQGRALGVLRDKSVIYQGSFKTPTVRNVAATGPYFHNGSYSSLEDVVDFYVRGGGSGIGLTLPFQTLPFDRLDLSSAEQQDVVAFLRALTDTITVEYPRRLPASTDPALNSRKVGGSY